MQNIFIFHGVGGHPGENWFPWLKKELSSRGYNVIIPQFPTPEGQTLENWLQVLDEYHDYLNEDTILIGHSLGVPFALNVVEKYRVKAAFLVAGYYGSADENEYDASWETFSHKEFDWQLIRKNCKKFMVYESDNDPYVNVETAQKLANKFNVEVTLVKGAGHFNQAAGYIEFERLLEDITT
ncbi:RBBP9/YdeN family alpha/beta hydrolase [Patescibacteria group bacterium]